MIGNDLLRCALTALLLAALLYAAFRAGRKSAAATRIGFGLHAAMMAAMVLMLNPGVRWVVLPQILFFGLAAWWYILRTVSRHSVTLAGRPVPAAGPGTGRSPGPAGRGRLLYYALTMAAMAYMLAAMDLRSDHVPEAAGIQAAGVQAAGSLGQAVHHGGVPAPGLALPGPDQGWSSQTALVLAVAFGLATAVWTVHLLRRPGSLHGRRRADTILDVVGAASMAVMFAALTA
ncbi:DUF5134 domain-containing protein [Arthrobacter sp. PsM3]|uniref:DUF5134 domain-containing protein n=1 Tax=Arthrobacter sp. PsM3 TaxID=3030531 RepID=UPI00263BE0BF|nr:DUF5134 domain-containing protein [Arthrobacter sp. PsM3]MDN4644393.1 DUF5134 domain-containing protein [Arthrobacter sp. PsM3]